jgi:hypothetical protein
VAGREIKSTLEIAMEKLAKIPKLTPEEALERREREFALRGRAIANRYLEDALRDTEMEVEICEFQDEEREIVTKALKSSLCDAISPEEMDRSRKALEALLLLEKEAGLEGKAGELEEIHTEYLRQRERVLAEFTELEQERLGQLGISGSAVRPNPEVSPESQQKLQEAQQAFSSRIEDFKRELLQAVATPTRD